MSDTKWKDLLLRSSLPLEHVVASQLADLNWRVRGPYAYTRANESGTSVEFSADIIATKEYSSKTHWLATLEVLLECKYATPGVKWLFLPYPKTAELFSGVIKVFDETANKRVVNHEPLERFEDSIDYCIRGVALHGGGCDENAISHGSSQLRYAMPRVAESTITRHLVARQDEDIAVGFACAVLVTTAPLFCLKPDLSLEDVRAAESIEQLLDPKESIVLWDEDSPDRARYCRDVYRNVPSAEVEKLVLEYASVFKSTARVKYPPSVSGARMSLFKAGNHVLVTSLEGLAPLLKSLDEAVARAVKSVRKIANVTFDKDLRRARIEPLSGSAIRSRKRGR